MKLPMAWQRFSLVQQNAALLALTFVLFELLAAAIVAGFVMVPMARRSADDLANLMVLSAQTWSELPPATRVDFELELARKYQLALRAEPSGASPAGRDEWHAPYLYFLEAALNEKTGNVQHVTRETVAGTGWYWRQLSSGGTALSVGFPERRIGAQPIVAFLISSAIGLVLSLLAAIWLARRSVVPLARLEEAARRVGRGEAPALLPETGPRELAVLAQRFNEMASQVRELLSARTTLFAGISHDLRTPMARMRLALALLAERPSARLIERLEAEIQEMDGLIGKALDLARNLEPEAATEIELVAMLNDMIEGMPPGSVKQRVPRSISLFAPPSALRRTVGNLLDNALRYGAGEPVELVAESDAHGVSIGVLDRGPGIPAEKMNAVFQPFQRIETSRSQATGGAGLGLAIVRQLAETHGWQVEMSNRPGGGLEVWLRLSIEHVRK